MNPIGLGENITKYFSSLFGDEFIRKYEEYINSEYYPYIRISVFENEQKVIDELKSGSIDCQKVESVPRAYRILSGKELLGKTLEYTLGNYYIQSLSSMIPALMLNPSPNDIVLDLCAAPGSKTTLLAELMNNRSTLYANEPNKSRIGSLVFNLDKMALVNIGVLQQKGELLSKSFDNYFDKILVDAPCSGLGIVQKKNEVNKWWNENRVDVISDLQTRLLVSAVKMLKSGGEIIYSTCTLTVEENEMVVNTILKKYPMEIAELQLPVSSIDGFTEYEGNKLNPALSKARRIIPWQVNSEGFFITRLIKTGETEPAKQEPSKNSDIKLLSSGHKDIKKHLNEISSFFAIDPEVLDGYKYFIKGADIYFINSDWHTDNPGIFNRIGIKFANIDKNNRAHLRTYSVRHLKDHIHKRFLELQNEDELNTYMNGGIIKKNFDMRGQVIIKYKNNILGTAISMTEGLKSQFPRASRTHEISI
ncbi:MAG: RsmB/NOP family class I SAM-dependent RNA methyltransferase [bacterium]